MSLYFPFSRDSFCFNKARYSNSNSLILFNFQIESFVFNDDNELDNENESNLNSHLNYFAKMKQIHKTEKSHEASSSEKNSIENTIDADTRIKLEALLANAGKLFNLNHEPKKISL